METMGRFPSRPLIRVPFFLLFGFYKGTQQKGKRLLLGHLGSELNRRPGV